MRRTAATNKDTPEGQETRRGRFERLAERRTTEVLRRLRLIGNLANRQNYDYTEQHIEQMLDALETEMRQLKQRFRQQEAGGARTFSFKRVDAA